MSVIHVQSMSYATAKRDGEASTVTVCSSCVCYPAYTESDRIVCKNDDACAGFQTRFPGNENNGGAANETSDMVCYKGGLAIERNWQMCDVTSEPRSLLKILGEDTDARRSKDYRHHSRQSTTASHVLLQERWSIIQLYTSERLVTSSRLALGLGRWIEWRPEQGRRGMYVSILGRSGREFLLSTGWLQLGCEGKLQ